MKQKSDYHKKKKKKKKHKHSDFSTRSRQSVYVNATLEIISVLKYSQKNYRFKTCVFYIICAVPRHPAQQPSSALQLQLILQL